MSGARNFVVRPEHILLGFLQGFFSQPVLFNSLPNEFQYTDGTEENSLVIQPTGDFDHETPDALPALVLQEGGFQEQRRRIDQLKTWEWDGTDHHKTNYRHPFTLHCITRYRGTSKLLQGAAAKALRNFRNLIYRMGVDEITPINGQPSVSLDPQEASGTPETHDAALSFSVLMANDWMIAPDGEPVEQICISTIGVLEQTDFDENGDPILPSDEYITQNLTIDNS